MAPPRKLDPGGRYGATPLVDDELAEHERWRRAGGPEYLAAQGRVGGAGSDQRTEFIVGAHAAGWNVLGESFFTGLGIGALTGITAAISKDLVPFMGGIIGGAMTIHTLATRSDEEWQASFDRIKGFGKGEDEFEMMANSLDSIAEVLSYVSMALNLYNLYGAVVGGIVSIVFPPAFPVIAGILTVIGLSILAIDAIRATVIAPLAAAFRALHMFHREADPRLVEAEGQKLTQNSSEFAGFVGGMAGMLLGHKAGEALGGKGAGGRPGASGEKGTGKGVGKSVEPTEETTPGAAGKKVTPEGTAPKSDAPRIEIEVDVEKVGEVEQKGPQDQTLHPDTVPNVVPVDEPFLFDSQAEALAKMRELKAATPEREVGLRQRKYVFNKATGEWEPGPGKQWSVVQGDRGGVGFGRGLNPDEWFAPDHSHPNERGTGVAHPVNHIASSDGDMSVLRREMASQGFKAYREAVIHLDTPHGPDTAMYGFDPHNPNPIFLDAPDPVTGERVTYRFRTWEAYERFVDACKRSDTLDLRAAEANGVREGNEGPAGTRTPNLPGRTGETPADEAPPDTVRPGSDPTPTPGALGAEGTGPDTVPGSPDTIPMPTLKPGQQAIDVVPRYAEPPATPQQLAALAQKVEKARAEQARAAGVKEQSSANAAKTAKQAEQLTKVNDAVKDDKTKASQHAGKVDATRKANDDKGQHIDKEKGAGDSYEGKKASINQLYNSVSQVQQWTALGTKLRLVPMDRAQKAADRMEYMNKTAGKFLASLKRVDVKLGGTKADADKHQAAADADKKRVEATKEQSDTTKTKLDKGEKDVVAVRGVAVEARERSVDVAGKAAASEDRAGQAAATGQATHDDLEAKLREWAVNHRLERRRTASKLASQLAAMPGVKVLNVVT